ncbi:MAG TPA: MarR family winged helix-turn-helix transcriptional regulator [Acidimicrobiales bacterium]|nr:MarR family winged helix-turn-helix transcriptional regulator [Acidimicrobiales bacterium]
MVQALFTLVGSLERARRGSPGASTLGVLEVVSAHHKVRPSDIAELQQVHASLVTRQVRSLEEAGYVDVTLDPADHRSCLVSLTPRGNEEVARLREIGLQRFAKFVSGWEPGEVRTLTALLKKLEASKVSVSEQERRPPGRRWAQEVQPEVVMRGTAGR